MSLEKFAAWGTIVCAVCAPPGLFFAAAVFFQWKPESLSNLNIVSLPVGVAIIVLLLGVFPWIALFLYLPRSGGRQKKDLIIDYAGYGLDFGEYHNTTEKLAGLVENGGLSVRVTNAIPGFDPYPNEEKQLLVIYSYREKKGGCPILR
jgi:hypothetical protein